jgi:hypothetical protein
MTSRHLAAHRDRSLRAATVVTALLATLTVATTTLTASLLEIASPAQVAVQPGLQVTRHSAPAQLAVAPRK